MNKDIIAAIEQIVSKEDIYRNELMSRHTTFRTGGPASLFIRPSCLQELISVVKLLKNAEVEYFVLGNGSNLLVSDSGYDGVVISLGKFSNISLEGETRICADAGAMNSNVAAFARDNSLTGFEFAAGIPGTIGGAMIMNAGAYGGEMKDVVTSVCVLEDGRIKTYSNEEMDFSYRHSRILGTETIVLAAEFSLKDGNQEEILATIKELNSKRVEKQPLNYPSAGSTFKRPEGYFAGKLIEDAGLKGYRVGDAMVSEKHSGFVVNVGEASAKDVYQLIQDVQSKVKDEFDVLLEPEVRMIGRF